MPTPRQGYYSAKDRKRLPSVTTVISRFKDSGALVQWAYGRGQEHERLRWQGEPAPSSLYEESGSAADIGTAVHASAEHYVVELARGNAPGIARNEAEEILRRAPLSDEQLGKAQRSLSAFFQWCDLTRIEFVHAEVAMVSETLRTGGTLDWIGRLPDGSLVLGDWKTSNAIYGDHIVQCAAYHMLWTETHPDEPLIEGAHVLRFSKAEGDFAHHHFATLENERRQFRLWRESYELDQQIRKRV